MYDNVDGRLVLSRVLWVDQRYGQIDRPIWVKLGGQLYLLAGVTCRSKGGDAEPQGGEAYRGLHIQQDGSEEDSPRKLPLYCDGKERARFAYAAFCLSKVRIAEFTGA